mgnify:CR=1 FL=1
MSIPDSAEYIDIARGLAEKVAGRVEEIDEGRRIPADLAAEIADAGLFRAALYRLSYLGLENVFFQRIGALKIP